MSIYFKNNSKIFLTPNIIICYNIFKLTLHLYLTLINHLGIIMRKHLTPEMKQKIANQVNEWQSLCSSFSKENNEVYQKYGNYLTGYLTALSDLNIRLIFKDNKWMVADDSLKIPNHINPSNQQ